VADKLENKLRIELDKRLEPDYITSESLLNKLKSAAGRYSDEVRVKHIHIEEDAFKKVLSSVEEPTKKRFNGVSQFILNFVEANGEVTFTEMNDMYKAYTKGSNSFSHILKALLIPYKNRPTQRYLAKTINGKYIIKVATPYNWVIVDGYDEFSNQ
jgi:CRISPR/Cas system-associated protein Csm6